jgi:hypothetical protein
MDAGTIPHFGACCPKRPTLFRSSRNGPSSFGMCQISSRWSDTVPFQWSSMTRRPWPGRKTFKVFEKFVRLEHELVALLQQRLEQDQKMLREMGKVHRA